jgi:mono/diheme cytochrome c family protein
LEVTVRAAFWMILLGSNMAMAEGGDATKGGTLYLSSCTACHGKNADGQGPASAGLNPKPTDFTSAKWWEGRTDTEVEANIKNGKPGTAMMSFAYLTDAQILDIVAYLRTKQPAQ